MMTKDKGKQTYKVSTLLPGRRRPSGFAASSTAEEVTHGICGTELPAIASGASMGVGTETARVLALCGVRVVMEVMNLAPGGEVKESIIKDIPAVRVWVMQLGYQLDYIS